MWLHAESFIRSASFFLSKNRWGPLPFTQPLMKPHSLGERVFFLCCSVNQAYLWPVKILTQKSRRPFCVLWPQVLSVSDLQFSTGIFAVKSWLTLFSNFEHTFQSKHICQKERFCEWAVFERRRKMSNLLTNVAFWMLTFFYRGVTPFGQG